MPNDLNNLLAIAQRLGEDDGAKGRRPQRMAAQPQPEEALLMENPMEQQQPRQAYSAEKEMEEIRAGRRVITENRCGLPKDIFDELTNNPIDIPVPRGLGGEEVDPSAIVSSRSLEIMNKIDRAGAAGKDSEQSAPFTQERTQDRMALNEAAVPAAGIDDIRKIVAEEVRKGIAEALSKNSVMFVRLGSDGVMLMDTGGSVYSCEIRKKGKGRIKKSN